MNLSQYVGTLNLLGDESRLRLCALLHERELSVSDLVRVTGISQSRVSTHLARLREGGFVRDRREGQHAFYALAVDRLPPAAKLVLEQAMHSRELEGDRRRLDELGRLPEAFAGEMERHYSPGRTWQSLAVGLASLLRLGDVLDLGSGDGSVAGYLAPYCRSLTCVDASPRMIDAANERLADCSRVTTLVADAHDLPLAAHSFDDVLLFHTLAYAEDPAKVLAECARVLRPKGRVVILTLDAHDHAELTTPYGERHAGFSVRSLKNMLGRAGFEVNAAHVASRESKKPHFQVVLAIGTKS